MGRVAKLILTIGGLSGSDAPRCGSGLRTAVGGSSGVHRCGLRGRRLAFGGFCLVTDFKPKSKKPPRLNCALGGFERLLGRQGKISLGRWARLHKPRPPDVY